MSSEMPENGSGSQENPASSKKKGSNWSEQETRVFLAISIDKNIIKIMDGKKHKHSEIYELVAKAMREQGFIKTAQQLQVKMKHLKEAYYKCKRQNEVSGQGRNTFPFFDLMDELLNARPKTQAITDTGIDSSAIDPIEFVETEVRQLTEAEAEVAGENITDVHLVEVEPRRADNKDAKKGGRSSYTKNMNAFTDKLVAEQTKALKEVLVEQNRLFTQSMDRQFDQQRQWEQEMMEREQEHQNRMMENMFNIFVQGQSTSTNVNLGLNAPSSSRFFRNPFRADENEEQNEYSIFKKPETNPKKN